MTKGHAESLYELCGLMVTQRGKEAGYREESKAKGNGKKDNGHKISAILGQGWCAISVASSANNFHVP